MDWITVPEREEGSLPDVLPSLLAAMGTPGFTDVFGLPACHSAAVLLIDGLGWTLLREHAADAPFLAELATGSPIKAGFPTTTSTSITSLGTGRRSGEHGIVGYSFADPLGTLLYPLSWNSKDAEGKRHTMLKQWPPETAQPRPTVLERAADAGVPVHVAVPSEFEGSGLTRAALRGGKFHGSRAFGDLAADMLAAVSVPGLCYGYQGHLDLLGHIHGPGSPPWRFQLRQLDRLVAMIAESLPSSALLAVVADHGMVGFDPTLDDAVLDVDSDPALHDGVRLIGGEVRSRHVYTEQGARDDVLAVWRDVVGDRGAVITGAEAVERGWFGPVITDEVRARIGDVIAVMRDGGLIRSSAEPTESALRGQHGSLTAAEQLVPLLVAPGQRAGA